MKKLACACLSAAGLVLAQGGSARAAVDPPTPAVVISAGYIDAIYDAGPIPDTWLKSQAKDVQDRVGGFRAGYKCRVFTILWAVIHRKECTPVAFAGEAYLKGEAVTDPSKDWVAGLNKAIGDRYKLEDLKLSFWARHGRLVLAGILAFLVLASIIRRMRARR